MIWTDELDQTVTNALDLWELGSDPTARLINVAENLTFLIEASSCPKYVLRLHRPGYHSKIEIYSELAWVEALRSRNIVDTPFVHSGRNGNTIQELVGTLPSDSPVYMVMFEYIEGTQPDQSQGLTALFADLGELAARTHLHSSEWEPPSYFDRPTWDLESVLGPRAIWGSWKAAPNVTSEILDILERAQEVVTWRLSCFGMAADRFGLVHADMRLANILVSENRKVLIDFDDCGYSWHLYDFAAAVSFMETSDLLTDFREAWVEGYRTVRPLSKAHEQEIDSLVMLRRMVLLAWIGSHAESTEPKRLAPTFASDTADIAEQYLTAFDK